MPRTWKCSVHTCLHGEKTEGRKEGREIGRKNKVQVPLRLTTGGACAGTSYARDSRATWLLVPFHPSQRLLGSFLCSELTSSESFSGSACPAPTPRHPSLQPHPNGLSLHCRIRCACPRRKSGGLGLWGGLLVLASHILTIPSFHLGALLGLVENMPPFTSVRLPLGVCLVPGALFCPGLRSPA